MHLRTHHSCTFSICVLLILLRLLSAAPTASAQAVPLTLRLAPELALSLEQTATGTTKAPAPGLDDETRRRLKEGRARLTAGVSLLVGGLIGAVIGLKGHTCYGDTRSSRNVAMSVSGLLVGGLGLGITLSGVQRMKGITQSDRQRHQAPGWLVLLGVVTTAASFTTVVVLGLPEAINCSSS